MLDFSTIDFDTMMKDIIDIFNTEGVELVRLSGLFLRERNISNYKDLQPEELDKIVKKLKNNKIIKYDYILYCPHCKDVTYQIKKRESLYTAKVCDTCNQIYIPEKDISLFDYVD